ncbi:MAG TPA: hypothetical protein VF875_13865 [Anaeromyxobacter sp.]
MRPSPVPHRRSALLLLSLLAGCKMDFPVPAGAQVACGADADCPGGWICPATLHKCVQPGGDQTAPALAPGTLVVTPVRVGLATGAVTFAFQVSEALAADPEVSIRLSGPSASTRTLSLLTKDGATHQYTYVYYPVPGTDPEGDVAFVARFVDRAGNEGRVDLPGSASFDFTPPALAVDAGNVPVTSVTLTPPATSPLRSVTAVTVGTILRVDFASAEMLAGGGAAPVVRLGSGGATLTLAQLSGNGLSYVYQALVPGGLPDGLTPLAAHLTDLAGNTSDVSLGNVEVKTTPPASPAVGTHDWILFRRIPWGSQATGGIDAYFLKGAAGSVPANALVIVYSDPLVVTSGSTLVGREVARTWADANGAFGGDVSDPSPFPLYMGDSPDVYVAAVDAAGNVSDADGSAANGRQAALVRDVAWTATMAGKVQGRTFPNPHGFEGRQVWTTTLAQLGETPIATPADVGLQDGVRASTRGAPHWLPARTYGPLSARADVGVAHDPVRGCRVAFGGTGWDGCDAGFYCGQRESCQGKAWQSPTVTDPEGDGNPSLGFDLPLVFAGGRGATVLFDGTDLWEWNGSSWRRFVMTDPEGDGNPAPRTGHAIAYDEARQRLLLFGGVTSPGGAFLGDTWETDFRSWKRVCTGCVAGTSAPAARSAHAMTYDPVRKVTVLVGGRLSSTPTYDAGTWTWDGAAGTWTRRCNTGTCATVSQRESTTLAFNPLLGHAVLFGGSVSGGYNGATYEWDGSAWTQKCTIAPCSTTVPVARSNASMFHDPDRGRTVLLGGVLGSFGVGECPGNWCGTEWEWNGSVWTQVVAPNAGPPSVSGVTPVYDPVRDRVVLFGGQGASYSSGTYLWDGVQWSNASPGTVPAARANYAAAWVPNGSYIWMANGEDAGGPIAAAHWWSGANWFNYLTYPTARTRSAMATSTRTTPGAVLFGGRDGSFTAMCDTWEYISPSWTSVRNFACGTSVDPSARYGHAMVRAAGFGPFATPVVVMFGGLATSAVVNDVWHWSGSTVGSWSLASADGTPSVTKPPRRTEAGLLFDAARNRVLMSGGNLGPAVSNLNCVDNYGGLSCHDYWEWSGAAWTRVYPVDLYGDGSPTPGYLEGIAYDTTRNLGVGLESGGTNLRTWWWYGGAADRPGEVMSVMFDAAQVTRPYDILDLQATWVGGGTGAPGGTTTNGATLQVWDNTAWRTIFSNGTASPTSPATMTWQPSTLSALDPAFVPTTERQRFLVGDGRMLFFGLVPSAASGSATGMGEVATDYAEVTVRYRLQ